MVIFHSYVSLPVRVAHVSGGTFPLRIFLRQVMTDPLLGPPNIPLNYDEPWRQQSCLGCRSEHDAMMLFCFFVRYHEKMMLVVVN